MTTLKDHLIQILQSRQFDVEERDGYLYGQRDDVSVVVLAASDLISDDIEDFIRNVKDFSGRKVVASLSRVDDRIHRHLQELGIHYWGREEMEHEIGTLHLSSVSDTVSDSLLDDVISDEAPQAPVEPTDQSIPIIVESTEERAEQIVKPTISLEDVKYIARHEVQGYRFDLELIPHFLFHYVLNIDEKQQRAGIVAINAMTEHVETWRWGFELVDSIDAPTSKREPAIEEEKALEMARDVISKEYRSYVETVRDYGHAEVIERGKPRDDAIIIESKGLVYLPVWCVEGKGGALLINSASGKIMSEHLHGPESMRG
ncbi:MAG: hypothetical protein JSU93_06035 [Methanobacteriota archaeon]|nr:MAG: hypothetical protein JSU93_06035 [Euryarchaeota archaeon]